MYFARLDGTPLPSVLDISVLLSQVIKIDSGILETVLMAICGQYACHIVY
jgi:hypothetical protein